MGKFFAKLNPDATPRTVARRAVKFSSGATMAWGVLLACRYGPVWLGIFVNPRWQPGWLGFVLWIACAAIVGAVFEWQEPHNDD